MMRKILYIIPVILLSACTGKHILFQNGNSEYSIVIDKDAPASEQYAACELQSWLREVGGVSLPIVGPDDGEQGKRLVVGYNSIVQEAFPDAEKQSASDDSFTWRSKEGDILFWGGSERGTLYSVYDFLEDQLGIRWYSEDVTVAPKAKKWSFSELCHHEVPALVVRDNCMLAPRTNPVFSARLRNNFTRLPGKEPGTTLPGTAEGYWGVHAMAGHVPADKYFKEHPEYFSLYNGKRCTDQLCLSNPEVLKICIESMRKAMRENPDFMIYSMEQLDNMQPCQCQCEDCQAIISRYGGDSGIMVWFVNQVADAIKDEFPDKYVGTFAYRYTRHAPTGIVPRDNVVIRLCSIECCLLHDFEGCEMNQPFMKDLQDWSAIAKNLYIWDYATDFSYYCLPVANFKLLQPKIKTFCDHNAMGMLEQGDYQTRTCELKELRAYLVSKLMWNPDEDVEAIIKEFTDGYYGPAGKHIREYINYADTYLRRDGMHTDCYANVAHPMFTTEFVRECARIFDDAKKAVRNEPEYLQRVETSELPVVMLQLELTPKKAFEKGVQESFRKIVARDGIVNFDEFGYVTASEYQEYIDNFENSLKNPVRLPAQNIDIEGNGVAYTRYEGGFVSTVEMLKDGKVTERGVKPSILIEADASIDHFGYEFETILKVDKGGVHMFQITTDDGAVMLVDGQEVFNRDGSHSILRGWAALDLEEGLHRITVRYFDDSEGQTLDIYMVAPDGYNGPMPVELCFVEKQ